MRKLKRLWISAIETNIDGNLVRFLGKLKVINHADWRFYMQVSHTVLNLHRAKEDVKRFRQEAKNFSIPNRPPRSIKPTKDRKF